MASMSLKSGDVFSAVSRLNYSGENLGGKENGSNLREVERGKFLSK